MKMELDVQLGANMYALFMSKDKFNEEEWTEGFSMYKNAYVEQVDEVEQKRNEQNWRKVREKKKETCVDLGSKPNNENRTNVERHSLSVLPKRRCVRRGIEGQD